MFLVQFESDFQDVRMPGFALSSDICSNNVEFLMRYSMLRHYAEGHVVHHVDPDPQVVGVHHVGVKVPGHHVVGLHRYVQCHNDVLKHHGVQGYHVGPHVHLQCGLRPFCHDMTSESEG